MFIPGTVTLTSLILWRTEHCRTQRESQNPMPLKHLLHHIISDKLYMKSLKFTIYIEQKVTFMFWNWIYWFVKVKRFHFCLSSIQNSQIIGDVKGSSFPRKLEYKELLFQSLFTYLLYVNSAYCKNEQLYKTTVRHNSKYAYKVWILCFYSKRQPAKQSHGPGPNYERKALQ